jgi:hypothetical protein
MFLQKLLTNYQLIKTLPLGNVLRTTKIDYYGPFLLNQSTKSYDLVSPLYNKPFGAFFPPSHALDTMEKDAETLQQELNQIISHYLKTKVYITFLGSSSSKHHLPFELLQERFQNHQFEGEVFITPFGDSFELKKNESDKPQHDLLKLNRIKNELRFVCDDSYQHILKTYEAFILSFKTEILNKTNSITFENGIFTTNESFQPFLLQAGLTTELHQGHLHWKFPLCLNNEDENTIIKIFKSIYKINEAKCLS